MTKQKKIAYLTYLFISSEHFGDFDYCFECAIDSLNYEVQITGQIAKNKDQLRKFFLSYTMNVWAYDLSEFI